MFGTITGQSPIHLVLLGAPGVGKGTFASRIGPHYNIPAISTGDLVRAEIKKPNSSVGAEIKSISERGGLVSDSIILNMLQSRLQEHDAQNGFLLDGFPRRVTQADALNSMTYVSAVLNITLREDILINKICSRRVCSKCGRNYNLADIHEGEYVMPPLLPRKSGICDNDGGELIQRNDDTENIVRDRLKNYQDETYPLIEYYNKRGLLLTWDVKKGLDDTNELLAYLDKHLRQ